MMFDAIFTYSCAGYQLLFNLGLPGALFVAQNAILGSEGASGNPVHLVYLREIPCIHPYVPSSPSVVQMYLKLP